MTLYGTSRERAFGRLFMCIVQKNRTHVPISAVAAGAHIFPLLSAAGTAVSRSNARRHLRMSNVAQSVMSGYRLYRYDAIPCSPFLFAPLLSFSSLYFPTCIVHAAETLAWPVDKRNISGTDKRYRFQMLHF